MYQALYRKWRPRTFDDVVGQSHITDTLKQQISSDRLSHAYLFTGTRGTGKTSCAKILSRAVNCLSPIDGNPCNHCIICKGIENSSILDVLELDAASNNGVDQVRALRDEAVYTPASTRRRVYIIDEVHMLSTPAFNALLKILEEPPPHLLFILATTELHKVPATVRSRCQQFAFKRILPDHIATRLSEIAPQESIPLTPDGSTLLARLADGSLRDALSLLDQCAVGGQTVDVQQVLDILGLAGNVETVHLIEQLIARDVGSTLETFSALYAGGRDISSVLGELSSLCRDLLLKKTAPKGSARLLTGGYDETIISALEKTISPQRLLYMLKQLQSCTAALPRSSNRRTDAELCLIHLCDESLDDSPEALSARITQLELKLSGAGVPVPSSKSVIPQNTQQQKESTLPIVEKLVSTPSVAEMPPWDSDDERPPLPDEPPIRSNEMPSQQEQMNPPASATPERTTPKQIVAPSSVSAKPTAPAKQPNNTPPVVSAPVASMHSGGNSFVWSDFAANLKKKVPPSVMPYLTNPQKVVGTWQTGVLTLWVDSEFTKSMLNKAAILEPLVLVAEGRFGIAVRVAFQLGKPPQDMVVTTPVQMTTPKIPQKEIPTQNNTDESAEIDKLDELLALGAQFDNITIK